MVLHQAETRNPNTTLFLAFHSALNGRVVNMETNWYTQRFYLEIKLGAPMVNQESFIQAVAGGIQNPARADEKAKRCTPLVKLITHTSPSRYSTNMTA